MNRFGQQSLDHAASRFDNLAISRLEVKNPRCKRAFGIAFPHRAHPQARLIDHIFNFVVGVSLVSRNPGLGRKVEVIPAVGSRITGAARR